MTKLIPIAVFTALIFLACKGTKSSSTEEAVVPVVKEMKSNELITSLGLKRSSCYGQCPTFEYIVQADGSFTYNGKRFVENLGKYEGTLPESSTRELWEMAEGLTLSQYKRDYKSGITDVPISSLKIGRADSLQLIFGDMDLPKPVLSLMAHLDTLSKSFPMDLVEAQVPRNAIPGEVILDLKSGVTPEEISLAFSSYNLTFKNKVAPALSYYVFTFDPSDTNAGRLLAALKKHDKIKEAQFNKTADQRNKR